MLTQDPRRNRSPPETNFQADGREAQPSVMRPVPRRVAPPPQSSPVDTKPAGLVSFTVPSDSLCNPAKQRRRSAWARYESPAASNSPPPPPPPPPQKQVTPPPADAAMLATQAAARQMWEQHAVAESDTTDSASAAPDSPNQSPPRRPKLPSQMPPFSNASMLGMQEAYLSSLKAALGAHIGNDIHVHRGSPEASSNPKQAAGRPQTGLNPDGMPQSQGERPVPANGSLSILPEPARPTGSGMLHSQSASAPPGAMQVAGLAHIARLSQQLEELLRSQGLMQQAPPHLPILASEPPLYGGGPPTALAMPSAATRMQLGRNVCEGDMRGQGNSSMDMESLRSDSSTLRAWNSMNSIKSDASLYHANSLLQHHVPPQAISNLSAQDSQTLLHSIQLLCQANEMAAVANSRIQAFSMAANANLEGLTSGGLRKRKMSDLYDDPPKRHSSLLSESESYGYSNASLPQMCAECGTTSTPTWRRSGKKLMCNACGLRRSRSMRSARSNSMPLTANPRNPGSPCGPSLGQ